MLRRLVLLCVFVSHASISAGIEHLIFKEVAGCRPLKRVRTSGAGAGAGGGTGEACSEFVLTQESLAEVPRECMRFSFYFTPEVIIHLHPRVQALLGGSERGCMLLDKLALCEVSNREGRFLLGEARKIALERPADFPEEYRDIVPCDIYYCSSDSDSDSDSDSSVGSSLDPELSDLKRHRDAFAHLVTTLIEGNECIPIEYHECKVPPLKEVDCICRPGAWTPFQSELLQVSMYIAQSSIVDDVAADPRQTCSMAYFASVAADSARPSAARQAALHILTHPILTSHLGVSGKLFPTRVIDDICKAADAGNLELYAVVALLHKIGRSFMEAGNRVLPTSGWLIASPGYLA